MEKKKLVEYVVHEGTGTYMSARECIIVRVPADAKFEECDELLAQAVSRRRCGKPPKEE